MRPSLKIWLFMKMLKRCTTICPKSPKRIWSTTQWGSTFYFLTWLAKKSSIIKSSWKGGCWPSRKNKKSSLVRSSRKSRTWKEKSINWRLSWKSSRKKIWDSPMRSISWKRKSLSSSLGSKNRKSRPNCWDFKTKSWKTSSDSLTNQKNRMKGSYKIWGKWGKDKTAMSWLQK